MHAVIELLSQAEFVRWVQNPDEELDAFWKQWMIAHPDRIGDVKLARELLSGMRSIPMDSPSKELKQDILLKVLQDDKKTLLLRPKKDIDPPTNNFGWDGFSQFQRVVAVLFIGFLTAVLYTISNPNLEEKISEPIAVEWVSRKTKKGEKLKITLPDKTEVWLNASTEISYPERFEGNERSVTLRGEAFFDVHSDSLQPFVVSASGLLTKAVGTSFTVYRDRQTQKTKVSLASGKVQITHPDAAINEWLAPGQQLIFDEKNHKTDIGTYDWKREIGWKEGWLVFKKASFIEVVDALENWYGVKVKTINHPTRKWDYSGEYQRQTLDNILESMAYIEQFTYTINENQVTIKF
ncbi:FecR family protein [Lunatibacter salilacus]|uniref:FecR family protein n=1 Tax=Lunatibacter salilacus TaxID=2483804 RepID=UPI00131DAD93|nr:FecR family protein [Lunatibacter salilacus]